MVGRRAAAIAAVVSGTATAVVLLLTAMMRGVWSYWRALPDAMVASERRRIACDLHDGLAQELAYLTRNLDSLEGSVAPEALDRLRGAAERGRLESRLAVSRLTVPASRCAGSALADAVGQVARRFAVELDLDLQPGIRLPAARSEALVRIACEAVSNAARHSGAPRVSLNAGELAVAVCCQGFAGSAWRAWYGNGGPVGRESAKTARS